MPFSASEAQSGSAGTPVLRHIGGGIKENNMGETTNIEYTVQIWRESHQFIAHAMPLDVMSSGSTP